MKSYKIFLLTSLALASINQIVNAAAVVTIAVGTNGSILADALGNPLSGGPGSATASAVNGDGTAVQVGYYLNSTPSNPKEAVVCRSVILVRRMPSPQ